MTASLKQVLGSFSFVIFWLLAVFPAFPFLPIGRTAGSLLGAVLMVIFRVISPSQAYSSVDLSILGLLFGTMMVSVYLERADAFKYLGKLLTWKSQGPKDLIFRVCLVSAIASAFFTNDTCCTVLTEFSIKIAAQHNLPPLPFLLALASSANIGSSATPIGNPQNLVIALTGDISFYTFLVGILPAALVGVFVNAILLLCMYWRDLSSHNDEENPYEEIMAEDEMTFHRFSPATMSHFAYSNFQESSSRFFGRRFSASDSDLLRLPRFLQYRQEISVASTNWKSTLWKSCVYLVTIGMLIALIMGLNMSWTSITAALVLVVIDFRDAQPSLEKVSYPLLVFFCGMFMTIEGFNKTGIPSSLWELMEPYAQIDHASGIAVVAFVILILSNVISNVPIVLLLGARMAASAAFISPRYVIKAWLILAWVSTVAGNLSLLGSAANMIVSEQARRVPRHGYYLSFWSHLKFGIPSTLIVTAIGLILLNL
ncbi:hypothetical protein P3X46_030561 [Hevea brasiliensis]|uniref:Citrate transporter-like domain-containing protein n=1 Tax=Hevea brasiliensis TaxID=3981 RepID=A0ABQ9KHQ3_HEVBR|nr:silicon efflux transporter LSI2-like [Hevea brasiliensis]KAJ9139866.1 hypothetical protein P3X46_030561 [Hevea brasiliensis]